MKLVRDGSDVLYMVSSDVKKEECLNHLLDGMWDCMRKNNGCGLAANQVGYAKRVFVMDAGGCCLEIINPVITKRFGGRKRKKECCLSYPGKEKFVSRYDRIVIEGFDREFNPIKKKLDKLAARCAQHELDHLNGVTLFKPKEEK